MAAGCNSTVAAGSPHLKQGVRRIGAADGWPPSAEFRTSDFTQAAGSGYPDDPLLGSGPASLGCEGVVQTFAQQLAAEG